jgi:hypothetical protein
MKKYFVTTSKYVKTKIGGYSKKRVAKRAITKLKGKDLNPRIRVVKWASKNGRDTAIKIKWSSKK